MRYFLFIFGLVFLFTSCRKKTENPTPVTINKHGFFVVNEGNYTWANSSLSFYDETNDKFYQDIFYDANAVPLGDVAYSMTIYKDKGYIVVNNSGIIYMVNMSDMKFLGKITGFCSPRQMLIVNDSLAYVSDLYDTRITIINLLTNTISGYVPVGHTTEKMILLSGKIFVVCWSYENLIFSLDALTGNKLDSAITGKQPNSIVADKNGNLWVLCDGGFSGSQYGQENASLWCLNSTNLSEIKHFIFPNIQSSPTHLCINGSYDTLFFINNDIFKIAISEDSLPVMPAIAAIERNFYGLTINPITGDIIVTNAKNYVANGEVFIYNINGLLKKTFTTGVNPGWVEILKN